MRKGFTLIELMVVILIIGVLSGMVITVLKPQFFYGKGRNAERKSDLQVIKSALELYRQDNSPDNCSRVFPTALSQSELADYLSGNLPTDPSTGSDYSYAYHTDPEGDTCASPAADINQYYRKCFQLSATLENGEGTCYVCGGTLSCISDAGYTCDCPQ